MGRVLVQVRFWRIHWLKEQLAASYLVAKCYRSHVATGKWRFYALEEELGREKKKANGFFLTFLVTPLFPHFKDH